MTDPNPKRASIPAESHSDLSLFRLVPIAAENDPRWDMATYQGEVVVSARSYADARLVAADAEKDFMETNAKPGDGTSTDSASAFRDDKLYSVVDEPATGPKDNAPRGVVSGRIVSDVIAPTRN